MPFALSPGTISQGSAVPWAHVIGEIGIIGVGAVASGVYNAIGKRIRADHPGQAALSIDVRVCVKRIRPRYTALDIFNEAETR